VFGSIASLQSGPPAITQQWITPSRDAPVFARETRLRVGSSMGEKYVYLRVHERSLTRQPQQLSMSGLWLPFLGDVSMMHKSTSKLLDRQCRHSHYLRGIRIQQLEFKTEVRCLACLSFSVRPLTKDTVAACIISSLHESIGHESTERERRATFSMEVLENCTTYA
jgi:hypothetical protein